MDKELLRRAVKNPADLTAEELEQLRSSAGEVELTAEDLDTVAGGMLDPSTEPVATLGCCDGLTNPKSCKDACGAA